MDYRSEDSEMSDADDEELLNEGASLTAIYLSTLPKDKASTLLASIPEADQEILNDKLRQIREAKVSSSSRGSSQLPLSSEDEDHTSSEGHSLAALYISSLPLQEAQALLHGAPSQVRVHISREIALLKLSEREQGKGFDDPAMNLSCAQGPSNIHQFLKGGTADNHSVISRDSFEVQMHVTLEQHVEQEASRPHTASNFNEGVSSSAETPAVETAYPSMGEQKTQVGECEGGNSGDTIEHEHENMMCSRTLNLSNLQQLQDPKRISDRMQEYIGGLPVLDDSWGQSMTADVMDEERKLRGQQGDLPSSSLSSTKLRGQQGDLPSSSLSSTKLPCEGQPADVFSKTEEEEMLPLPPGPEFVQKLSAKGPSRESAAGFQHLDDDGDMERCTANSVIDEGELTSFQPEIQKDPSVVNNTVDHHVEGDSFPSPSIHPASAPATLAHEDGTFLETISLLSDANARLMESRTTMRFNSSKEQCLDSSDEEGGEDDSCVSPPIHSSFIIPRLGRPSMGNRKASHLAPSNASPMLRSSLIRSASKSNESTSNGGANSHHHHVDRSTASPADHQADRSTASPAGARTEPVPSWDQQTQQVIEGAAGGTLKDAQLMLLELQNLAQQKRHLGSIRTSSLSALPSSGALNVGLQKPPSQQLLEAQQMMWELKALHSQRSFTSSRRSIVVQPAGVLPTRSRSSREYDRLVPHAATSHREDEVSSNRGGRSRSASRRSSSAWEGIEGCEGSTERKERGGGHVSPQEREGMSFSFEGAGSKPFPMPMEDDSGDSLEEYAENMAGAIEEMRSDLDKTPRRADEDECYVTDRVPSLNGGISPVLTENNFTFDSNPPSRRHSRVFHIGLAGSASESHAATAAAATSPIHANNSLTLIIPDNTFPSVTPSPAALKDALMKELEEIKLQRLRVQAEQTLRNSRVFGRAPAVTAPTVSATTGSTHIQHGSSGGNLTSSSSDPMSWLQSGLKGSVGSSVASPASGGKFSAADLLRELDALKATKLRQQAVMALQEAQALRSASVFTSPATSPTSSSVFPRRHTTSPSAADLIKEVTALRQLKMQQQHHRRPTLLSQASSAASSASSSPSSAIQAAAADLLRELDTLKLLKAQHYETAPSPLGGGHHRTLSEVISAQHHTSANDAVQRSASLAPQRSDIAAGSSEERAQLLLNGSSFSSVASFTHRRQVGSTDVNSDAIECGDSVDAALSQTSSFQAATRISRSGKETLWSAKDI
ncbi:hypothetical protein CEUSTIGMA_g10658.t1 [Chlamydomonas eustigma]|uniref:Uncharacterized protein n=1 Tax=Chlamydomonas eustigma TaxID=1157962 RepID=A0A250XJY8_9CHLO|nr:hypothetical protein CEUSTIGMA_g10658.t1 [Chlamydomonas eustigma]|eukprot:GAX83232.1 hypothetical protein CEUSTIGMA_g10658.t1 [Chlamydomonas eustigma]